MRSEFAVAVALLVALAVLVPSASAQPPYAVNSTYKIRDYFFTDMRSDGRLVTVESKVAVIETNFDQPIFVPSRCSNDGNFISTMSYLCGNITRCISHTKPTEFQVSLEETWFAVARVRRFDDVPLFTALLVAPSSLMTFCDTFPLLRLSIDIIL